MEQLYRLVSVFMCRLRPSQQGDILIIYLMKLRSIGSEDGVELSLTWVIPSLLLSLCLVSLYDCMFLLASV